MNRQRRYYLHWRLRKYYRVHARKKQVDVPMISVVDVPEVYKEYLKELAEAGYNIQYTLD